ncbi:MAG: hypothetical protein CL573_06275 [Alphaproteobacteria bacterium]|nr:hypothetical protein [Alphaproteobacteria bacterium]HCP00810.1 hypothetical protein [Rhodospirillaceae bacterium]
MLQSYRPSFTSLVAIIRMTPLGVGRASKMVVKRNITFGSLRTNVRLEPEFWDAVSDIAARERLAVDRLCKVIDASAGVIGRALIQRGPVIMIGP